jgi:hypothetical protein
MNPITPIRIKLPHLGARVRTARLTAEVVLYLRTAHMRTPLKPLAEHFGVHVSTVCQARRNRTWRWLPPRTVPAMEATHA